MSDERIDWMQRWRDAEGTRGRQESGLFTTYDALGRKNPRRLGTPDYLLLIARADPARVRRIPASAIEEEGVDDIGEFSFVNCPCGQRPVVRPKLEKCNGCGRNYVRIEIGAIWVLYGDMPVPALRS